MPGNQGFSLLFCYQHSPMGPQEGSSCLASLPPIKWELVQLRSKGELYSPIREWRGASSGSRAHTLPDRRWAGLLYRVLSLAGWVWSSPGSGAGVLLRAPDGSVACRVCAHGPLPLPPSWILALWAALLHTALRAEVSVQPFTPGTVVWSAGCEPSARGTLWANETRWSTKEKRKVRLDFITQILFVFPGNWLWFFLNFYFILERSWLTMLC